MKHTRLLCLALTTGILGAAVSSPAQTLLERIATAVLADKFGVDTSQVNQLQRQTNLSVYELAPIYQSSYYFRQKPTTIYRMRQEGLGYGQIAHRVGMQPGRFNQLRNQGAFDQDRFWTTSYQDRFGTTNQQVQAVRQRGGTLDDLLGSIVIGKLTKRDPNQVYTQYRQDQSWVTVTQTYRVRLEDWQRVSRPTPVRYVYIRVPAKAKPKPRPAVRREHDDDDDHGRQVGNNGHDQGKSKQKSKGKGKKKGGKD